MNSFKTGGIVLAALVSGCSLLPYDSHFLCEKNADLGHCTSVQGAYQDAVDDGSSNAIKGDAEAGRKVVRRGNAGPTPNTARNEYQDSEYRAMADMMDAPVSPVLAPAQVLRTLIVAYEDGRTLFMPRYVFYVVGEPHFVMGDYLSHRPAGSPSIYPNGRAHDSLGKP